MGFDPNIHHRRSIRIPGYDYSRAGGYFVTLVTQGRACLFGRVLGEEMKLNDAGKMIARWWCELEHKFPSIHVDTFVVMPNHLHGIMVIEECVGADLCVCPGERRNLGGPANQGAPADKGAHVGAPLRGVPRPNAPVGQIIQWFKTMSTNAYIRGVKTRDWPLFDGRLWQRNYYEHVIRDDEDANQIYRYIQDNPRLWTEDQENPATRL